MWFVLGSFLENPVNVFHISILNTVYLKKCSIVQVIAERHYVNLLIFLTILVSLIYNIIDDLSTSYIIHIMLQYTGMWLGNSKGREGFLD